MTFTELVTIIVIAVGLAMDALAVSIAAGAASKQLKMHHALRMAFFFGAFQAVMPLIGSFAGLALKETITSIDHWIAFFLLSIIGAKMIYESFKLKDTDSTNAESMKVLLALSIATSIDALAVGVTLSLITSSIFLAVTIIGITTFILSLSGAQMGRRLGHFFENKIEIFGGLILIAIGAKILIEHILFGH
ncbi:MAG: manganese efflux pump [Sedimentisphaerales bacterium]|nr:manganese efflux pump [Sedimentisphaerales bacterium]